MPTIEVEFSASCKICGTDLETDLQEKHGVWELFVKPCEECLENAREQQYKADEKEFGV